MKYADKFEYIVNLFFVVLLFLQFYVIMNSSSMNSTKFALAGKGSYL